MKRTLLLLFVLAVPVCLFADDPVMTFPWSSVDTAQYSTPAPAGSVFGGGVGGDDSFYTFTTTTPADLTVTITDCCIVGDIYELVVDGTSLGLTSIVPYGGPTYSTGTFVDPLSPGSHTLGIDDILLQYIGSPDPYGGSYGGSTIVGDFMTPAGFYVTASLPEPGTLLLLGTGLLGLAGGIKRRLS